MTTIRTDLRNTRPSAKEIRFDPSFPLTATNVQDAINQAGAALVPPTSTPVNFAASPYNVLPTDRVLLVDTAGGAVTINMMAGAARGGFDLEIKDDTGHADANPISVVCAGADTVDGLATYPIDSKFSAVRFLPKATGYDVV